MIRGTVKTRFKSDYYEYKVSGIELLSEVRNTYVKSITINVPLAKLNAQVVKTIENLVTENKGKALLKFNVHDPENNMFIEITDGINEDQEVITGSYRAVSKKLNDDDQVKKVDKKDLFKEEK